LSNKFFGTPLAFLIQPCTNDPSAHDFPVQVQDAILSSKDQAESFKHLDENVMRES